ncbi:ArsR/SmtB family transcription factor [Halorhabdus amylolytica]|uniref:ArsR/SmtB family transcription factor n=1 Tax=Halorhabdus amylolytica TaxID=2559573 RepID=UPI0010AB2E15|nr:helix-turn-helix domain-containing protein [Halorhabdus amylolytica]
MSRLLPGRPDSAPDDREPAVLALDDDRADGVFDALGSETARTILQSLHAEPRPASELTDEVGTTLQNVQYHLTKLRAADLVAVVDTWYGENGAEMDVYAPTDEALVLFAGENPASSLRGLMEKLLGVVAVLAIGAFAIAVAVGGLGSRGSPSPAVNASVSNGDYTVAVEPAASDPLLVAGAFVAGGLVAVGVLLTISRLREM